MPKLPHSEPLAAELSGAVDRGAHAVDRRIGKTLSAYFLTEQAAFFILIALVKTLLFTHAIRNTIECTLREHSIVMNHALRQNGGYCDRQKADFIFTGAAGSCISERGPVPLRRTVAGAVGNFRICGAIRFSDDLQLLRPPAHSTGTAVCHGLFPAKNTQAVSAAPYYDGCCPAPCAEGAPGTALCPWGAVLCSAACGKHFSPANLDSLQPFSGFA